MRSGSTQVGLGLLAVGYGSRLAALAQVAPSAHANRVLYQHPGLEEWYANGPLGLEQGFTIARAPGGHTDGPLTLSMVLSNNVKASLAKGGQTILMSRAGRAVLRYTGLLATDASGRALHSWLQLEGGRLLLRVDAAGVRYPLRIDPMIQQGEKLTGTGAIGTGRFGYSVALSADGNTALIGARYESRDAGAAWVFTRSGSTWTQQGGKLIGTGHAGAGDFAHVGEGEFGFSVALSGDGNTALIGGPTDNSRKGAAWVFTRTGSTWTQQGEKLTGGGEAGEGRFGFSVALSGDGNTALIGGPGDNSGAGAAWVFTRSGSAWTPQGAKLVGTSESGLGESGTSVALSADGNTALLGGPVSSNIEVGGAAWVFTRTGSTWSQQGEKLTGAGETGAGKFGYSAALSASGDTALIGGPRDNGDAGAAWVFTRSGSTWAQQGEKLTGGGETGAGEFGYSVALSEHGDTALIGGPQDATATGAAWVLTRTGGVWSQQGPKLTGSEEGNSEFGVLVALSADGNTALIGGWNDNSTKGAAWVFTRSGGVWSQQGGKLTGGGETGEGGFGTSVALSADGNTALIGGPGDNRTTGAAWVFTRSGSTWTQQGEKLTGTGEVGSAWFGYTVALSGDGNTALIGGWLDSNWEGAAWVFTRSGSTWTQQGSKLTGGGETGRGMFGTNVALSADGNTALIGAWNDNTSKGAAWVFTRTGASWAQQGEKLTGTGESGEGRFGVSVALSADGNTALIGALDDNSTRGAAWMFTRSGSTWTQQGEKLTGGGEAGEGEFGTNVALSADGNTALIGAWRDNGGAGAAWVFVVPPTEAGGTTSTTEVTTTTTTTTTPPAQPSPAVPSDTPLPPAVQHARQSTTRWREGNQLARISRAKTPTGTIFSFALNEQATVTFSFAQRVGGRRVGGQCVTQTERNRRKPACRRTATAGTLTFTGHGGPNRVAFQGSISPVEKLKPGRYTLVITATNSAGLRSAPKSLSFTIVK